MPDRRFVLAGLALFLLAASYPAWRALALGTTSAGPTLAKARRQPCILAPAEMRASHMSLLAEWRDMAVRRGVRRVMTRYATPVTVSLTGTCLDCHEKAKFCDRCHAYAGVTPECWSCHVVPVSPGPEGTGDTAGLEARPTTGGVS